MRFALLTLSLSAALLAGPATAGGRGESPVVVELYTSQGCSGCLEASSYAGELSQREGVLLLSFGVDYWDYLGWSDTFANAQFVERQRGYTARLDTRHPYTPQMVVDGHVDSGGYSRDFVNLAIQYCFAHLTESPPVSLTRIGDTLAVDIGEGAAEDDEADVWLVAYHPGMQSVAITRGENADASMPHYNVVETVTRLGGWNGEPVRLSTPIMDDVAYAVLVQRADLGAMIAAAVE